MFFHDVFWKMDYLLEDVVGIFLGLIEWEVVEKKIHAEWAIVFCGDVGEDEGG